MKKTLKIIFTIILIIFIKLLSVFLINEIIISNYENGIYNTNLIKSLYIFNFNQPYIAYYNNANILYKKNEYDEALDKYNKALNNSPPKSKICDIRINISLTLIKQANISDSDKILKLLEEARRNLYNDNCANENDDNGKSKEAETLEQEIKNLEKQMESNSNNNSSSEEENDTETELTKEEEKNIEEQLKNNEKEASANRQNELDEYENMGSYSSYTEKYW